MYVNFGSITTVTKEQLVEFGMGLAESCHPFLWIIRPDMVAGDSAILPPEYTEETKERSFICSWCPQEEVLNHPSIGGFLTHSGWGSTMESISSGVPMLCWPFFGDQQTNCRYTCSEWGIGMEIDSTVKRENVRKLVTELMEGEKAVWGQEDNFRTRTKIVAVVALLYTGTEWSLYCAGTRASPERK
uniref:anthocyanidin 3-O-glucosyltransferase n=1 Tax=Salix viminalis TaxID=40686 RepID=A0A6N2JZ15_SALVM